MHEYTELSKHKYTNFSPQLMKELNGELDELEPWHFFVVATESQHLQRDAEDWVLQLDAQFYLHLVGLCYTTRYCNNIKFRLLQLAEKLGKVSLNPNISINAKRPINDASTPKLHLTLHICIIKPSATETDQGVGPQGLSLYPSRSRKMNSSSSSRHPLFPGDATVGPVQPVSVQYPSTAFVHTPVTVSTKFTVWGT